MINDIPLKLKGGSFEPPVIRDDKKRCSLPSLVYIINMITILDK